MDLEVDYIVDDLTSSKHPGSSLLNFKLVGDQS